LQARRLTQKEDPKNSSMIFHKQSTLHNCGQIAVASLTDNPVDKVEAIVGHTHGTRTHELIAALQALQWYALAPRCISVNESVGGLDLPDYAILQVRWNVNGKRRNAWHWVALADRMVYDGGMEAPMELFDYRLAIRDYPYLDTGRITACLPVQPQATAEQTRQK
jgi:hypothetical protein